MATDYRDDTPLTDAQKASLVGLATAIRTKMYGKDVREAIASAIETVGKPTVNSYFTPKGVVADLATLKSKYPNGTDGIYITSDDGYWCYWDGNNWQKGNVYQGKIIPDGSITAEMLQAQLVPAFLNCANVSINSNTHSITIKKAYFVLGGRNFINCGAISVTLNAGKDSKGAYTSTYLFFDPINKVFTTTPSYVDSAILNYYYLGVIDWNNFVYHINASDVRFDSPIPINRHIPKIEIGCRSALIDTTKRELDLYHVNGVFCNGTVYNLAGKDYSYPFPKHTDGSLANAVFVYFNVITLEFYLSLNYNGGDTQTDEFIYAGYIDTADNTHSLPIKNLIYQNDRTTNFLLASDTNLIADFNKMTLTVGGGFCNIFFADGTFLSLKNANPDPIDIKPSSGSSIFIFLDRTTGLLSANANFAPNTNQILLGYINFDSFRNYFMYGIKVSIIGTPYKNTAAGLNATAFGDSITWSYNPVKWCDIVLAHLRLASMTNNGVAGSTYTKDPSRTDSAVERVGEIKNDLITVEFGVNDFHYGRTLGKFGDTDQTTFYGALDYVYSTLLTNNPNSKIFIITPTKQHGYVSDAGNSYPDSFTKNSVGLIQEDYVNAIKEVANKYSLPVIDMFNVSGMSPFIAAQKTLYFKDGLHPNQAGEYVYGSKVANQIKSLI